MPNELSGRNPTDSLMDILSSNLVRRTNRQLDQVQACTEVTRARVQAAAEKAAAVVRARNAVAAAAAQADAQLAGLLAALPIQDETDADFKRQIQTATRANVIADLYGFQP